MDSALDKTAFVVGASYDVSHAVAQILANEFPRVIVLDNPLAAGCGASAARPASDGTALRLDTNGTPLRDWDD